MDTLIVDIAIVLAGLLLRLGIPIATMAFLAWFLRRLDARWQAESEAAQRAPQPPFSEVDRVGAFCWQIRDCSHDTRQRCPAYQQPTIACWNLFRSGGRVQKVCRSCPVYNQPIIVAPTG